MSSNVTFRRLRQFLFPHTCILCRKNACLSYVPVCKDCLPQLREMLSMPCGFCGLPAAECICPHSKQVRSLFWYDHPTAHQLIAMVKYRAKRNKVEFLADRLAALCNGVYDGVTYVPRRPKEKRLYGYDHGRLLAQAVAKRLALPLVTTLECNSVLEQKYLSGAQREKSMYGRYTAVPKAIEHYPRLLLVDDLYTTGATMRACSRILRQNGAKAVSCVTLARVQHQYQP